MSKKRDNNTLSEKLSSLIQTKPSVIESEDEDLTTVDKITAPENDSDFSADELDVPKFRKLNNQLLDEDDTKYSGRGVSRKDLKDTDDDLTEEELESDENDEEDEVASGEEDSEEDNEAEDESEIEEDNKLPKIKTPKNQNALDTEIISKSSSDIEKGKGIKNQLHVWDFLLECRMKFQKSLVAANQFPSYKDFHKFNTVGGPEFQDSVSQTKKSLRKALKSLLNLQKTLLELNEEYHNIDDKKKQIDDDSNEEITSNSEDDECTDVKKPLKKTSTKLKNLSDFAAEINKRHKEFENYRNNTIQKWNDKTRIGYISNKNFSAFEQSTLKQIEHVLLDKPRLIKRTQTKRSSYHILGQEDEPPLKSSKLETEPSLNSEAKNKTLCKEIFDDDDFYHQLLSELVKRKASDVTDPVQLGRQWMQLQKIRSKMKKTVDTKASKGRKIRFVVHPKLVNFMMPMDNTIYNEESRVELFNSLFGKNKKL